MLYILYLVSKRGGKEMHESEWLPRLLLKSDLLNICNLFNLSIDGFRKDKLHTRPVEQLRSLVSSALVRGIGAKKMLRGKIPMHLFYAEVVEDVKDSLPLEWRDLPFDELVLELNFHAQLRTYQKLALVYEWHNEHYMGNFEMISKNATDKKPIFQGIVNVNEEELVEKALLRIRAHRSYPAVDTYVNFIASIGAIEKMENIKINLQEKESEVSKLNYIARLEPFEMFLGIISLLPEQEQLKETAYSMYLVEKEKQIVDNFQLLEVETADSNKQCMELTHELDERNKLYSQLEKEFEQLTKKQMETDKSFLTIQAELDSLKKEAGLQGQKRLDAEKIKGLFEELVPISSNAVIITDQPDPRIKEVFKKSIFSKKFLLKEKQSGNITKLKNKTWFIDRQAFTNTQEWLQIRNYLLENGFYFEEYNDYIELLKQYIQTIDRDTTEEYAI